MAIFFFVVALKLLLVMKYTKKNVSLHRVHPYQVS